MVSYRYVIFLYIYYIYIQSYYYTPTLKYDPVHISTYNSTTRSSYANRTNKNAYREINVYSDDEGSCLSTEANASASRGNNGMQTNAGLSTSIVKTHYNDTDVHFGKFSTNAGASFGSKGAHAGVNAQLNALSFENKRWQGNIGLDGSTGGHISRTGVSVKVFGLGFNVGEDGVGFSTPFGGFHRKRWW
jgi:hypothetical protein